jgi:hypothetical protein
MVTNKDIVNYVEGNWRYFLYKVAPWLLKKSTKVEFESRKLQAEKCLINGSCYGCGCKTPEKFMSSDACKEGCYEEIPRSYFFKFFLKTIIFLNLHKSTFIQNIGAKLTNHE